MKKQKIQELRQFFVRGGKGTNTAIADTLGVSPVAVRVGVHRLRCEGMEIIKTFPRPNSRHTVYSYAPGIREGLYPVYGRPPLP